MEKELKTKRKKGTIGVGAMSDTYNPFERKLEITRGALKLIDKYRYGVGLSTKSDLITRDINIYKSIMTHSPVILMFTVTSADDMMSKVIEPNVCPSSKRFEALKKLADSGIYAGVLLMPVLPFILDTKENITAIVEKTYQNGGEIYLSRIRRYVEAESKDLVLLCPG